MALSGLAVSFREGIVVRRICIAHGDGGDRIVVIGNLSHGFGNAEIQTCHLMDSQTDMCSLNGEVSHGQSQIVFGHAVWFTVACEAA